AQVSADNSVLRGWSVPFLVGPLSEFSSANLVGLQSFSLLDCLGCWHQCCLRVQRGTICLLAGTESLFEGDDVTIWFLCNPSSIVGWRSIQWSRDGMALPGATNDFLK